MASINFEQKGSFRGPGSQIVLTNPTALQFGPDGRLYVTEQSGTVNAFEIEFNQSSGNYIAKKVEVLKTAGGFDIVKSIQNHNDDGTPYNPSKAGDQKRQVTGMVVSGTAANPVVYVSSSDNRIATNTDSGLDTNSGIITRATWTGTAWDVVDLIRGLPRSEENHSVNGMVIDETTNKLYVAVGGNTNNGAPSQFFAYTAEYALSGTVLEVDLKAIAAMTVKTDPKGGRNAQNGTALARKYIYDLPTLDDPNTPNNGVRENANGMDVAGPWGGNDGLNQAILPADAPLKIFADGFRNHYDLVKTKAGKLYTVDNGSNGGLGGDPIIVNGKATNLPNDGGVGDNEPLFLVEAGGYYGTANPTRSNQTQSWTVYNDSGKADTSLAVNKVSNISALVPGPVNIQDGFLIDPSKFTGNATRLAQSGIRVRHDAPNSKALGVTFSSSNGLAEYNTNGQFFDGALDGALLVTQFNDNLTVLNLNDAGTALEPLIDPGADGKLGTSDDVVLSQSGIYSLVLDTLSKPLDVITRGPDGTIWVGEFGGNTIRVYAPTSGPVAVNTDLDGDGIQNVDDLFLRDATNGASVLVVPGKKLLWDFDANADGNRPGPDGYGGGLTGVMSNGVTNYDAFFKETLPDGSTRLDNVKFITAAGGGTTVIEKVSSGDPQTTSNNGEYLFHTGVKVDPSVKTLNIKWNVFNPAPDWTGPSQQIGGYIGPGSQKSFLKVAAVRGTNTTNATIQVLLEDGDVVKDQYAIAAPDLLKPPTNGQITFELNVDLATVTAVPTITYATVNGTKTVSGRAVNLSGTDVLKPILGQYSVQNKFSGLALGLFSSNKGQTTDTFQAVFGDIEVTATGSTNPGTGGNGAALLSIIPTNNKVKASAFGANSFQVTNTGGKNIAKIVLDITNAIFPDTVFAPDQQAGDSATKPLTVDTNGSTGVIAPNASSYLGLGGSKGFEGIQFLFDSKVNGGFQPGETLGFSIDMDPNSVAGGKKTLLDAGSVPSWDVGGISGAELIGSSFIVTFTDGTTATGQLQGTNTQAGAQSLASQATTAQEVTLTVNGLGEGGVGTYNANGPSVVVNGPAGQTARIVLAKGFIQPVNNLFYDSTDPALKAYASQLDAQLAALEAAAFPANNAVEFQTVDIKLTGAAQNISNQFSFNGVAAFDFPGEAQVPLGFVASIIDPTNGNVALGPVTDPIYLTFGDTTTKNTVSITKVKDGAEPNSNGQFLVSLTQPASTNTVISYSIGGTATNGTDYNSLPGQVTIAAGATEALINVAVKDDAAGEGTESVTLNLTGATGDSNLVIGAAKSASLSIVDNDQTSSGLKLRVNAGGPEIAAVDGGPNWSADTAAVNSPYLINPGSNKTASFPAVNPGETVPDTVPGAVFDTERWDAKSGSNMKWGFDVVTGQYEVRLFFGNGFSGTSAPGERVFDVAIEGKVLSNLDNVDLSAQFGHQVGGMISNQVSVSDGTLDIEFLHQIQNPVISAIEVIKL